MDDPTVFSILYHTGDEPSMMMRDVVDFYIVLPFLDLMKTIELIDIETQQLFIYMTLQS